MRRLNYILVPIFLLFTVQFAFPQISDEGQNAFSKAEKHLKSGDYKEALDLYLVVLAEDNDNANLNFRVGQCYMNILGQERSALPYLKKSVLNVTDNYKAGHIENDAAAPLAWFLLGDAYHRDEDMEQASISYHKYREYVQDDKDELHRVSERIMALGVSQGEVRDHARDVLLTNMGDRINSKSSEYNIIYSGDEKTMVFTRYEKRRDIIFVAYLRDGSWTVPIDISEQIGSEGDMYATALSYDGTELYVVLLTAYDADIYVSEYKNGDWQYAQNAGKGINSKYIESNATISADGKTLYFSSDRASSVGGFDIFYSTRNGDVWSKAQNMGEVINTKENEESPHITNNGQTIYFSSDRPGSIGRMDIYFSRKEGDVWSAPENLGMPFNSVEDDISFKYYEKYRKGYIARDMPGGFGKLDLYLIQSGSDRQKELSDYMASLAPPEPDPEAIPVDTTPDVIAEETTEPLVSPEVSVPVAPVAAATTVIIAGSSSSESDVAEEVPEVEQAATEENIEPVVETVIEPKPVVEVTTKDEPVYIPEETESEDNIEFAGAYTVQILALLEPKELKDFNGLDKSMIRKFAGDDGFTRYIYGQYSTREEAISALRNVFKHSFNDAFVRSTSEISNFE